MNSIPTRNRHLTQRMGYAFITVMAFATVIPIVAVVIYIFVKGWSAISQEFLTTFPTNGMREGGIYPAIVGTVVLTLVASIFVVPLGIAAAIYLAEYARDTKLTRTIRIAIINLAGIPSVVYGLFGLGMFVLFFQFWHIHSRRIPYTGHHDPAGYYQYLRGGIACRSSRLSEP